MTDQPRILSTKLLASATIEKAAAAGILVECVPFIETVPVAPDLLRHRLGPLFAHDRLVVFTSASAVKAVAAALGSEAPGWRVACIEGATRKAVHRLLPHAVVAETAASAHALAAQLAGKDDLTDVTFICGNIRLAVLRQTLEAAGISVREIIAYDTRPRPVSVTPSYDGIVFFSPSAVRSYFSGNPLPLSGTVFFAIGNTTAAALPGGPNPRIVAGAPDADLLIDQVIHYFKKAGSRFNS